jgi:hypothetical protein
MVLPVPRYIPLVCYLVVTLSGYTNLICVFYPTEIFVLVRKLQESPMLG